MWAAENVAFGSGGALLQKMDRDTQKCAFKCCEIIVDGKPRPVYKDPITDQGKKSKQGRLKLVKGEDGNIVKEFNFNEVRICLRRVFHAESGISSQPNSN